MLKWPLTREKKSETPARQVLGDLDDRIHRLEIKLQQLQELHEQLQGHHDKLRSKFYGELSAMKASPGTQQREPRTVDFVGTGDTLASRAFRAQNR